MSDSQKKSQKKLNPISYFSGLGNIFATETKPNLLPGVGNSPQKVAYDFYAEQINGTAFTAPRHKNFKTWMYRSIPSARHGDFKSVSYSNFKSPPYDEVPPTPQQLRWNPIPYQKKKNFLESINTMCGNGSIKMNLGCSIHLYSCDESMDGDYFSNADGHMIVVPQEGKLLFKTELGLLAVEPNEIIVIPRGIRFQVELIDSKARGYICENYGSLFQLPELGPIGANGLANPSDFLVPVAWNETKNGKLNWINKYGGCFWSAPLESSVLNVAAWRGNYYPYKYDLRKFNTIGSISYDHPDPSIFTVLTSPSNEPGTANIDFVIFPPRWLVAENTFRPPYYHRNCMSEFMGLIHGEYDAKTSGDEGFKPGGASLHNRMTGHGPDTITFEKAGAQNLSPQKLDNTMAFMFESQFTFDLTPFAIKGGLLQKNYLKCWD